MSIYNPYEFNIELASIESPLLEKNLIVNENDYYAYIQSKTSYNLRMEFVPTQTIYKSFFALKFEFYDYDEPPKKG